MDRKSDTFKRGIDIILKSDQYTDKYKEILLAQLGTDYNDPKTEQDTIDIDFDLLRNGGLVISESQNSGSLITVTERAKAVSGYLEKPTYLEDELIKAVDVEVDELISLPPKQKPLTVPKPVHDALQELYNQSISDLEDLRDLLNNTLSDLETANLAINLLNQTVDSEKLLRASADNEAQASTDRYTSVLGDFQTAMQKAIQEAIERVSLTAQVRGLQAQKEVLKEQLKQMVVIVQNLQQAVEESADALSDQQEAQAAQILINGIPGAYDKTNQSGWKITSSSIPDGSVSFPIYYHTGHGFRYGDKIDFYNLTEETLIFTFNYVRGVREGIKDGDGVFIGGPQTLEVPPRIESDPGTKPGTFRMVRTYKNKTFKVGRAYDNIEVTVSNGERYTIKAYYRVRER